MNLSLLSRGFEEVVARYGAIAIGLAIGTAAKYGLQLSEGKRLSLGSLLIDALLLGMLGLIAIIVADWLHLQGNARVMCGALAAVSSDRLIRLVRERFLSAAAQAPIAGLMPPVDREAIMRVPAGNGQPDTIVVQTPPVTPEEQMRSNLVRSYCKVERQLPNDQDELLRRIDGDPGT